MFNDKAYFEVNREERFFCTLFAHALLSAESIRASFAKLVQLKYGLNIKPASMEIYIEAAALRDYWNDLGDPIKYLDETRKKRKDVIVAILNYLNIPDSEIDKHHFFWTSEQHQKLWSPGRWDIKAMKEAGLEKLINIRWAFNAKPDIMLISDSIVLLIEGKLESGEGIVEETGYQQYDIQKLIADLLKMLVPQFNNSNFHNLVLGINPTNGISWKEVIEITNEGGLDMFSKMCLAQLARYYKK